MPWFASRWSAPPRKRLVLIVIFTLVNLFIILHHNSPLQQSSSGGRRSAWDKLTKSLPPIKVRQIDEITMNDARVSWHETRPIPQTTILRHTAGFTVFDHLYSLNETFYAVTDSPKSFPELLFISSTNAPARRDDGASTSKRMQIISTKDARKLLGESVNRIEGVTFLNNDHSLATDLLFGMWRAYSSLDTNIKPNGRTILPPPRRLIFTNIAETAWLDYMKLNKVILHSAFPSLSLEHPEVWKDRSDTLKPWYFDRVVFADRGASDIHRKTSDSYPATVFELPGSPSWFAPVRANVLESAGFQVDDESQTQEKPVITYISRQGGHPRKLKPEDHDRLVAALKKLKRAHGYEVIIQTMENLSRDEQLRLVGRTTILISVHGDGLAPLIWMHPSPKAAVMELFKPQEFTSDNQQLARALGIKYYGWWGSKYFASSNLPPKPSPPGLSAQDLPIDGDAVAALCVEHLTQAAKISDSTATSPSS